MTEAPARSDGVVMIRPLEPGDVEAVLAGEDDEIRRWFHRPASTPTSVEAGIERSRIAFAGRGPRRTFGVVDVASGSLCGHVEGNHLGQGVANISYSLAPAWRGRGHAVRAVKLCIADVAEALPVDRCVIRVEPGNPSSARVAHGCGFVRVGPYVEDGRIHEQYELDLVSGDLVSDLVSDDRG